MATEQIYEIILQNMNEAVYVRDADASILYMNPVAESLTGLALGQALGKKCYEVFGDADLTCKNLCPVEKAISQNLHICHHEGELKTRLGDIRQMRISISPLRKGEKATGAIVVMNDITKLSQVQQTREKAFIELEKEIAERKRVEASLRRREAILEAVAFASERFLSEGPGEAAIQEVLGELGQATDVSRVYVFENYTGENGIFLTGQHHEWVAQGIESQVNNPDCSDFPWEGGGMERWAKEMTMGRTIQGHVRSFPPSEQEILAPQGIESIVAVPIFVDQKWWGFIGFDECLQEREWSASEVDALKIAADILGAAIQHDQMETLLRESEARTQGILAALHETLVLLYDRWGNIRFAWAPSELEELYGLSREEIIGKSVRDLFPPEVAAERISRIQDIFETRESFREEYLFCCAGGTFWHDICLSPVLKPSGHVVWVAGFIRDITDRKLAEEELRKAREDLERKVKERTEELAKTNEDLLQEIEERKSIEDALRKRDQVLESQARNLEEANIALKVLLEHREENQKELEERVLSNVRGLLVPFLEKLRNTALDTHQKTYLAIMESNLNEIISPFSRNLSHKPMDLTPAEIQIANLIKAGKTSKEIAELLTVSLATVNFHRHNLRKKLGLTNRNSNLRSFLLSLS